MDNLIHQHDHVLHHQDDIVTDDCAVSRTPSFEVNQNPISYNRCDSGFNSGLEQSHLLQKLDIEGVPSGSKNPAYNRGDSGIYSQFSSLNINESQNEKREKVFPSGESQSKPDSDDYIELYEPDQDGDSQLHLAIASGYQEVVAAMVRLAPHPDCLNLQNNELYAPLHIAVLTDQPGLVRRLVVAGARTSTRDQEGNTPLHLASKRGCEVEMNIRDWAGRTPLQCARINGDDVIIALLASLGADTTIESEDSNEELEEEYDNINNDIEVRVLESRA